MQRTLRDQIDGYIGGLIDRGVSARAVDVYRDEIVAFVNSVEQTHGEHLQAHLVDAYLDMRRAAGTHPERIAALRGALDRFVCFCNSDEATISQRLRKLDEEMTPSQRGVRIGVLARIANYLTRR